MVLQRLDGGEAVMSLQLHTADDLPAQPPPPRSGQAAATLDTQNIEGSGSGTHKACASTLRALPAHYRSQADGREVAYILQLGVGLHW